MCLIGESPYVQVRKGLAELSAQVKVRVPGLPCGVVTGARSGRQGMIVESLTASRASKYLLDNVFFGWAIDAQVVASSSQS